MTLEEFILEHFGTKELAARRLKISRYTIYRWLARPEGIQIKYIYTLAQITQTDVYTLLDLCAPRSQRNNDVNPRKVPLAHNGVDSLSTRRAS
jgi:hypothetical protein